jgi:oxysterol-binding protein-related protein 1/2
MQGNSCLHCAAYRGHRETALLLMQNGIDTRIRNNRGQLAEDLAREPQMKQILNVTSVRKVQKTATRYEGPLLRRSRFLGWKPVWAVLERGVLNYFMSRADSTINTNKRKDFKYLDNARVTPLSTDEGCFVVHFNDGSVHRLSVLCQNVNNDNEQIDRQKWINAFNEHAAYSSHYLWGLDKMSSVEEDVGECWFQGLI